MDPSHHQPTVDSGDDGHDGMSIHEFLNLELPPETYPVSSRLQKMIAEILPDNEVEADGEDSLIDAVATAVVNLEAELVNIRTALTNARTICAKIAAYAINLEGRILEADVPIRSAQEEMAALGSALREDPI
jgi:hypothetical protein